MAHDPLLHVAPPILEAEADAAVKHLIAQTPGEDQHVNVPALTPQQVEAVDRLYSQQDEESRQVAQLLGVWGTIQFTHALAVDMLKSRKAEEEEEKRRQA
jgi:hypothetical protein